MVSILCCHSVSVIDSCSVSPFPTSFSVTLVVEILCCQSLCVIVSCIVSPFFSFFLCLPCVVSHSLSLIIVFCRSFFLINSVSHLWSQFCVVSGSQSLVFVLWVLVSHFFCHLGGLNFGGCQSFSVIDSCVVCPFSSLIVCHLCGFNLVLSVTLCHWLLFCQSFFLTHSLSPLWD